MPRSTMPVVEWRVCCVDIGLPKIGYTVTVHCRSTKPGEEPGQWRLVREVEYVLPSGPLRTDYWKDLLRQAAR